MQNVTRQIFRPLGAHERLMFHYSAAHPRHFCIVARLRAGRPAEEYRRAFMAIQARHPLLRANIAEGADGSGPSFVECVSPCEPTLMPHERYWDWYELVESELERDFDDVAPLFRGTILHDEAGAFIILTFHHAIADALAGVAVIEDFMRALAGEKSAELGIPRPVDAGMPEDIDCPIAERVDEASEAIPDLSMLLDKASQPLWRDFIGDKIAVQTTELDARFTDQLRQTARNHGTTVNSAICTALALAAYQREARSDYHILSAINLRPILGLDAEACVMRAAAGTIPITRATIDQFWAAARSHTEQVAEMRSLDKLRRSGRMLNEIISPGCDPRLACGLLATLNYDAVVSNLGELAVQDAVGDVQLEGIWGPVGQARLRKERFVGVATVAKVMRFIEARPTYQPPLLDKLMRNLRKVCDAEIF